ncbi:MAG: poly-gamma-glutamate synthase PgsB [Bacteroidota bacterium]
MVILFTILVILLLTIERYLIERRVRSIPIRIHVNGTRGKSSITRYITAILSHAQYRTYGKITGVVPSLIHPDGTHTPVRRRGKARVQEQFSILSAAAKDQAQALVMECMSLKPEYQRIESRFIRPTITVLTAIEDDHREEMGGTDAEQVAAIAESIPENAVIISCDTKHLSVLQTIAETRQSRVVIAPSLNAFQIAQLPKGMFADNAALAVAAAVQAGVDERTAYSVLMTFQQTGECTELQINDIPVRFINGFAVNDVPSADRFMQYWKNGNSENETIIILNTRNDRPLRTKMFAQWCSGLKNIRQIYITGDHSSYALRTLHGMNTVCTVLSGDDLTSQVTDAIVRPTDIFGFGNIASDGFHFIEQFLARSVSNQW